MRAVALVGLLALAMQADNSRAEVIDDIAVERTAAGAEVRLRLVGPVHLVRSYFSADGESLDIHLEALAPEVFARRAVPDEVRPSPRDTGLRFTARVTLDPRCDPTPHPVCLALRFERPTRARVRVGEDRRSLLIDIAFDGAEGFPAARDRP